jgi:glycosyltransferase 2 family protein
MRHWTLAALRIALTLTVALLIARSIEWNSATALLQSANPVFIATALACVATTPILTAFRWRAAAAACAVELQRTLALRATYSALLVGQFLPAGLGVDTARVAFVWKSGIPVPDALLSVALDRAAGVAAILALALLGLPAVPQAVPHGAVVALGGFIVIGCAATAALLFLDRIRWLHAVLSRHFSVLDKFRVVIRRALFTRHFAAAFCYGVAIHLLCIVAMAWVAKAMGYPLNFLALLTITSMALFASLLPISFNGWGVREGALIVGLAALNVPRDAAVLVSVLYGLLLTVSVLPGFFLLGFSSRHPARRQQ